MKSAPHKVTFRQSAVFHWGLLGLMCVWQGGGVSEGVEVSRLSGKGRGTLVWSPIIGHSTWKLRGSMPMLSVSPSFSLLPYVTSAGKAEVVCAMPVAPWNHKGRFNDSEAMAQMVRYLPAMWETWVQALNLEGPLEKEWLPTPVFLPGEFHGQRSLAGYSPWGCKSWTQLSD